MPRAIAIKPTDAYGAALPSRFDRRGPNIARLEADLELLTVSVGFCEVNTHHHEGRTNRTEYMDNGPLGLVEPPGNDDTVTAAVLVHQRYQGFETLKSRARCSASTPSIVPASPERELRQRRTQVRSIL